MRLNVSAVFAALTRMARPVLRLPRCLAQSPACVALLVILAPCGLRAETPNSAVLTLSPEQCVWRAGDNAAWAASNLDESGWHPYSTAKMNPYEPRVWLRCRLDRETLGGLNHPAVEIREFAAWELYFDGARLGGNGNLKSGEFGLNITRILRVPSSQPSAKAIVLSLRISRRFIQSFSFEEDNPLQIRLGDEQLLTNERAGYLLASLPETLTEDLPFIVLGLVGLVVLVFSVGEGARLEAVLLGINLAAAGVSFASRLSWETTLNVQAGLSGVVGQTAFTASFMAQFLFPFAVAERKPPRVIWLPVGVFVFANLWYLAQVFVPLSPSLKMDQIFRAYLSPATFYAAALVVLAPLMAFWPWNRIPHRSRAMTAASTFYGLSTSVFFATTLANFAIPGIQRSWMFAASTVSQWVVLAAIIALLLRDQRQIVLHRAELAGEMQAAKEIQRALVPASIETLPGLGIAVAFHPAREVGGDFYSCCILPGNRQRILLGDVSGKGAAAAMTAAVLLGATQQHENDSPAALLQHLNRVLTGMHLGGFATCLCAELTAAGALTVANAGHLAPYRNGEEVKIESGLPLGIAPDSAYAESTVQFAFDDTLAFLSDGVVEARDKAGVLFGFDRAAAISTQSAESIAQAAAQYGQEDDITVLTLSSAPAEALHA
jgi:serine phosphatase RsbU (regulator of sigma subunit)